MKRSKVKRSKVKRTKVKRSKVKRTKVKRTKVKRTKQRKSKRNKKMRGGGDDVGIPVPAPSVRETEGETPPDPFGLLSGTGVLGV